ncbi:uncharacterized protein J3D65DRAFT_308774 [Phyllosticta citribraziliensis]|uniref:Uncharacterized protein n=1 Tax=Phyllosticta citribraziliensis TaxID=989973 RepID=A0ABR1LZA1_9PEZI
MGKPGLEHFLRHLNSASSAPPSLLARRLYIPLHHHHHRRCQQLPHHFRASPHRRPLVHCVALTHSLLRLPLAPYIHRPPTRKKTASLLVLAQASSSRSISSPSCLDKTTAQPRSAHSHPITPNAIMYKADKETLQGPQRPKTAAAAAAPRIPIYNMDNAGPASYPRAVHLASPFDYPNEDRRAAFPRLRRRRERCRNLDAFPNRATHVLRSASMTVRGLQTRMKSL